MAMMHRFEDVIAWQKARSLTNLIYELFRDCKDYSFRDQIQRASISIMNNIAEGYERGTDPDFKHFLFIAKGSCGEVRSMAYSALDLKYISEENYKQIIEYAISTSALLAGFIKKLSYK